MNYKTMDIYASYPRKVICIHNTSGMYGLDDNLLEIGKEYTVEDVQIFDWYTEITLKEFKNKTFNSVSFAEIEEEDKKVENMTKQEALNKIKELEHYVQELDKRTTGFEKDEIFLLSIEEYNRYKKKIPKIKTWWWLRSPGFGNDYAALVVDFGSVDASGHYINDDYGVRPVLKYSNLKSEISLSKDIDCFIWNETKWKIIDADNEIAISVLPITFDIFDDKTNDYKTSFVRQKLLLWFEYQANINE